MFVVQFVVMALYQPGWSRGELIAATYSRNRTRACAGEASVLKINIFAVTIFATHTDGIALTGHDVNERVLPVKTSHCGVLLSDRLARFDRKAKRERVRESKAHDWVGHPW